MRQKTLNSRRFDVLGFYRETARGLFSKILLWYNEVMDKDGEGNLWQPTEGQPAPVEQPVEQSAAEAPEASEPTEAQPETPATAEDEQDSTQQPTTEKTKPKAAPVEIHWTASDGIDHQRGRGWYIGVIVIVVAISALLATLAFFEIFSLTTSITTEILVVVMAAALFVVTRLPAREVKYTLTDAGLTIEGQLHPFSEFRAFGVRRAGATWQLVLIPVKRFGASVTMFIHESQGEEIIDELGVRLPMEDVKNDLMDNLIRRLKI